MNTDGTIVPTSNGIDEFAHTADKLEFRAVLGIIAGYARSERSKERILASGMVSSVGEAEERQGEIEELVSLATLGESLPIGGWEDSAGILEKARADGCVFTGEELVRIAQGEVKADEVRRFLGANAPQLPRLSRYEPRLEVRGDLIEAVRRAIGHDFEVLDAASRELARLRRESESLRGRLRKEYAEYAVRIGGGKGYEFVTVRGERYVVSVPRGEAGRLKGIVHQTSASGASLYIEPLEFVDENNRLESLVQEERDEVARILVGLSATVCEHRARLLENQETLVELDCVSAKATFAERFHCIRPEHDARGVLVLRGARHPLLEKRFAEEGMGRAVKPLDLRCEADLRALVISGPNAGGKTIALKTAGLLVVMDRSGLLIPCDHGTALPDYGTVFVDIGDDQSIEKSLSTFSSRIVRLKRILELADERSLVLIDEIGDGTDPEEGAALAEAALERLIRSCGRTIVTTHLRALKGWAHGAPGAYNATLEFDPDKLEPLFILKMGVPGRSWGIEMAARLGLPPDVVERAKEGMGSEALRLEELLAHLEKTERMVVAERAALLEKETLLAGLIESYRDRLDRFKKDREELVTKARTEALEIVSSTRREMENLIREIRLAQAERPVVRRAHERVAERKREFEHKLIRRKPAPPIDVASLRPGMRVHIRSLGREGRVASIDSAARVFLELDGGLRVETGADDLARVEPRNERRAAPAASWTIETPAAPVSDELSVRGMERAEALERVDAFLDRAVLHGLRTVVIIHGIGRGILKRAIYGMLKKDPRVADVHPGEPARGGDGVAVVELR
jgi:DNA mismatch repair protein MutS2